VSLTDAYAQLSIIEDELDEYEKRLDRCRVWASESPRCKDAAAVARLYYALRLDEFGDEAEAGTRRFNDAVDALNRLFGEFAQEDNEDTDKWVRLAQQCEALVARRDSMIEESNRVMSQLEFSDMQIRMRQEGF
jgi:hypothetical protein